MPTTATWMQENHRRWVRCDGAVVKYDESSPFPNPMNPRSRMFTAWEPDPSQDFLGQRSRRGIGWPRRWKTAQAAMRAVDRECPIVTGEGSSTSGEIQEAPRGE
jgi:hypothetical protein